MCPTFIATGDELMSTRGRANLIRAALERRADDNKGVLLSAELEAALSNCLSCKACTTECPSNVNLSLLKAELLHARHERHGLPLPARLFSVVDALGKLGCLAPRLANTALTWHFVRRVMGWMTGIDPARPLPRFASERFDRWFERRQPAGSTKRGRVVLWDDTFVRYHDPHIGRAAVAVLEAAGFEVVLPRGRKCCGRPAFSQGRLDRAARLGCHNLELLAALDPSLPIVFLEPSCWSMFSEDYRELKLAGAETIAKRCVLFEQFVENLLSREPAALRLKHRTETVTIHVHCHAKSLLNSSFLLRLAQRLPGRKASFLSTGCCGMAGAFGMMEAKQAVSRQVAEPLIDGIESQPLGTVIIASGTSCRHQIGHLSEARPMHMAEWLEAALGD